MLWLVLILAVLFIGAIAYWQLIIAEGAYLGAPLVALLYDWTAEKYNGIKEFNADDEDFCLGQPLAARLQSQPGDTLLDVATGTGRIPLVMLRQPNFHGRVIGVDRAGKMLAVAKRDTAHLGERAYFIQADATALPFARNSVPAVTCLEALEFLPNPKTGLAELVRVLRPAAKKNPGRGWLLTTNRVGWEAKLMPGKTWSKAHLELLLAQLPLQKIHIQVWQDIYDLVWAQKTGPE
jgi:ubiquinone/menaquinone biosynthesis C-methylase UbiE